MAETVIQYVLRRLKEIGVDDVFGVAGITRFRSMMRSSKTRR